MSKWYLAWVALLGIATLYTCQLNPVRASNDTYLQHSMIYWQQSREFWWNYQAKHLTPPPIYMIPQYWIPSERPLLPIQPLIIPKEK